MTSYLRDSVEIVQHRDAVFVDPGKTLRAVAHTMWIVNVGALVVGTERQPLGVISERDIVSRIAQGANLDIVTAAEAMSTHLSAVRVGDTLDDAAYQMLEGAIRHLPVMDDEGCVVSMLSIRDLLRPLLSTRPERVESGRTLGAVTEWS